MDILIYLATGLLVVATLLPLSRHPHWLLRGMDFPRVQLATIAAVLIVVELGFLSLSAYETWAILFITALCLIWQLCWIVPYTKIWPTEVPGYKNPGPGQSISILTTNVLTPNRDAHKLVALVRELQPDVLVTLESDQWWESQLSELEDEMPETIKCPLDNLYGMHVYSRLPLHDKEISFLVEEDVPSMHALVELPSGDCVRMHFLHPAPPSPTENPESSERDAELVVVARSIAESDQPVIVTGDLNDVAWSRTTRLFRKLSGLLDPRIGRGMFNTFHADYPLLRWPLDHLFHSKHFSVQDIRRLPSIGSDHYPLFTRLVFTDPKNGGQQGLTADKEDQAFATSITQTQEVDKSDVPKPGA